VPELLDSPPSLRALYPRALTGAVAELPRKLPGLRRGEPSLPDLELAVRDVEIDREHVAAYDRVCGFRVRDELPPTYPHMVAFPLAMKLMTDGSFPFPVIGLVHIANRIEQRRPLRADERIDFTVRAADLREHDRGLAFDVVADASVDGERVWHSTSTYLRRGGGGGTGGDKKSSSDQAEPPPAEAIWRIPGDIGRRYASVSGDINPIHMHPLSARLFGFPKPIAHGMWLKARCLAALEGELPNALAVEVSFKLPLLLPAKVAFASWPAEGGEPGSREFAVHDAGSGKPHLTGSARPA
jgi:acyl dehydratase